MASAFLFTQCSQLLCFQSLGLFLHLRAPSPSFPFHCWHFSVTPSFISVCQSVNNLAFKWKSLRPGNLTSYCWPVKSTSMTVVAASFCFSSGFLSQEAMPCVAMFCTLKGFITELQPSHKINRWKTQKLLWWTAHITARARLASSAPAQWLSRTWEIDTIAILNQNKACT